ncbi:UDP-N-acetylglucosamine--N-acetylmuramyl-(pentapeptide) pyrophosphoryl-undecaprenol N-acetylglucosamine transferase, partial [Candidatus Dependentiae bacterium]|nr:UDP-N-acetylglucosamine--N-acetylmuramyl-(pentapeptide) pyrophosphoryl-undecaprenol N-acetylglucosamine transferase [Candidatus Dependentiae bacterium]
MELSNSIRRSSSIMLNNPVLQKPTLCVAAGKSGGHLIPALELAKHWHTQHPEGDVVLFTYGTALDQRIYKQYPFIKKVQNFAFTTFVTYKLWRYPKIIYEAIKAFITSYKLLSSLKAEKIITTGGFVAIPVSIAAKMLAIPVEAYELNVHPGKAIKALALLGCSILVVFKKTLQAFSNATLVDYPVRFSQKDFLSKNEAINQLNAQLPSENPLQSKLFTVFIIGGSQGSQYLNNLIIDFLLAKPEIHDRIQIIHQAGSDIDHYKTHYAQLNISHIVFDFYSGIAACYQAADLVICRAGAGTLFELKFFKRSAIIIPLVAASTSHQEANAHAIAE